MSDKKTASQKSRSTLYLRDTIKVPGKEESPLLVETKPEEIKPKETSPAKPKSEAIKSVKPGGRLVTVEAWGRGNANPLMRAFISEHKNLRTVKRTAVAWIELFRYWKAQPRG